MAVRWDNVNVDEGLMRCYISAPDGVSKAPGVIVIQHAAGVDEFVRGRCDRIAEAGFVAIAPDLYHREEPDSRDDPMTRMSRLRDPLIARDVDAAVEHAKRLPEVDGDRIGSLVTAWVAASRT